MAELLQCRIEFIETQVRPNPDYTILILVECVYDVVTDTLCITRLVLINGETLTVIFIQSIISAKPHKSFTILNNAIDCTLGQSLID